MGAGPNDAVDRAMSANAAVLFFLAGAAGLTAIAMLGTFLAVEGRIPAIARRFGRRPR